MLTFTEGVGILLVALFCLGKKQTPELHLPKSCELAGLPLTNTNS
jgi:hypothetical protein